MSNVIPIFPAKIESGAIKILQPQKFREYARALFGPLELILRRKKNARSLKQNSYYWSTYIPILAEHYGYDEQEMHEALKIKFLWKENGKLPTVRSTTKLNSEEFTEYLMKIDQMIAEDGIRIPSPDEYYNSMMQ